MFKELDVVRLTVDVPACFLKKGESGTVVAVCEAPEAYEVEFLDSDGTTKALVGLKPEQLALDR